MSTVKLLHRKVSILRSFTIYNLQLHWTEKFTIYTGLKKFTPAPPVVPMTNIRYDPEITNQNFTFQQNSIDSKTVMDVTFSLVHKSL